MNTIESTAREWPCTNEVYHGDTSRISNSAKEVFRRSQREYESRFVSRTMAPPEPTKALRIGGLLHVAVWEPERWARNFLPELEPPDFGNLRLKVVREQRDAWLAAVARQVEGKTIIDRGEHVLVENMREALYAHPIARTFIEAEGPTEHTITWTDPETGLELKSRRDKVLPLDLPDIKTTEDASPEAFAKSCANYGYARQAAWNIAGEHERTGERKNFVFLVVSKSTFEVAVYTLNEEAIILGDRQNRATLNRMAECRASGCWLAPHEKQITELSLPGWAYKTDWEL